MSRSEEQKARDAVERYLRRQSIAEPDAGDGWPPPRPGLRASIVIPVYDELDHIEEVVASLERASTSPGVFEVIVVVNHAADAPEAARRANLETLRRLEARETSYPLHVLDRASDSRAYAPEIAGVGRARREGADIALARLASVGRALDGLLPCLDGDSPVAPGYIDDLLAIFDAHPGMLAGVCRYRHPIPDDPSHARAMIAYEAWMRYWEAALVYTGTPYAFQSIGSCMVLTARGYALADGMPTLEALSDFYMLEKITKVGGRGAVRPLADPLVTPSARPSGRVPRGTGPSVRLQLEGETGRFERTEGPAAFETLEALFAAVPDGFDDLDVLRDAATDPLLDDFLRDVDAWATLAKLRDNAPSAAHFERHFHTWFDNLQIVKFANTVRRERGGVWIFEAARRIYELLGLHAVAAQIPRASRERATHDDRVRFLEVLRDSECAIHDGCASPR